MAWCRGDTKPSAASLATRDPCRPRPSPSRATLMPSTHPVREAFPQSLAPSSISFHRPRPLAQPYGTRGTRLRLRRELPSPAFRFARVVKPSFLPLAPSRHDAPVPFSFRTLLQPSSAHSHPQYPPIFHRPIRHREDPPALPAIACRLALPAKRSSRRVGPHLMPAGVVTKRAPLIFPCPAMWDTESSPSSSFLSAAK